VLKYVGGRHRGQLPGSCLKQGTIIALLDLSQAGCPRYGHLFGADINSCRLISIRQHQCDQLALAAADVENRSHHRRQQRRPDVAAVDEASRLAVAAARVLRCVRVVQALTQRADRRLDHGISIRDYYL
jgi:hypothetical protein